MAFGTPQFLNKVLDLLVDTICVVDAEGRFLFVSASCEQLLGYTQAELIGRNMIELVHPEDRARTLAAAANVMRDQPLTHFENRYLRKDGSVVHIMWSARWSEPDGIRLALARDVTPLKHAARMQAALYRISEAAHLADGLPALYRHIHRIIGELLPVDGFAVALHDAATDTLSYPYLVDAPDQARPPQALTAGSPLAEVIRSGTGLLTVAGAAEEAPAAEERGDWLGVPLISAKGVIGALVLRTHSGELPYTREHQDLLQFVSTQVATAIERKLSEARLQHMALHDALTGLANRALFHNRCDQAIKHADRTGEHLALLYLDLDDFKSINDTYGHEAGDTILREVARRLSQVVRDSDTVGRMGGDEFTVLLANIRGADAVNTVVEKVRAALDAPYEIAGQTQAISVSIGAALYPEHGADQDQLLRHADANMYARKRQARKAENGER